jgi:Mitochondrial resolvase Ydc2 / RNA splicing MRS1
MGIRNLALCLIQIPTGGKIPQISSWNRITVSSKPECPGTESFEPIEYAEKAYTLMKSSLEKYNPDTILIERQRYRSAGGSAIQEWTVRVNMLESMFHAVLHTLAMERGYKVDVHSVSPRKVARLWLANVQEKLTARETKVAKIAVADRILNGQTVKVDIVDQAKDIADSFQNGNSSLKKFDDLADSLLQGLGWWKWHITRSIMMEEILGWEEVTTPEKRTKIIKEGVAKKQSRRLKKTKDLVIA